MNPPQLQKLVILDGFTANPGDLSWAELRSLAPVVEIHDRTPADQVVSRCADADVVLTNKTLLPADVLARLPSLRYIGILATGVNVVDLPAATARGIVVTNVPSYSTASVVQMVFAYLLHWSNHVAHHSARVRSGAWAAAPDFTFWDRPLVELSGKTLGIIGFGTIGQSIGRVGHAFGLRTLAAVRSPKAVDYAAAFASTEEVFSQADYLVLSCPLTAETRNLVNASRLALMKPTAYLINVARGPVVDEPALAAALASGRLAGAATDVLCVEPPAADHPLVAESACLITPHNAWATVEARGRLLSVATANLRAWISGQSLNVVS